jgi:hypothetical protein
MPVGSDQIISLTDDTLNVWPSCVRELLRNYKLNLCQKKDLLDVKIHDPVHPISSQGRNRSDTSGLLFERLAWLRLSGHMSPFVPWKGFIDSRRKVPRKYFHGSIPPWIPSYPQHSHRSIYYI